MFRFKSLTSNRSFNDGNSRQRSSSAPDATTTTSGQELEIDDPLQLRLNHQRQFYKDKGIRKSDTSGKGGSDAFIGWGETEESEDDPFDLGSTSSEESIEVNTKELNTKQREKRDTFLGWGAGSQSSFEESYLGSSKSENLIVTELSIRGGLSQSTSSNQPYPSQQSFSGEDSASYCSHEDNSHLSKVKSDTAGNLERQGSHVFSQDSSTDMDEDDLSMNGRITTPTASIADGPKTVLSSQSIIFRRSITQDDETPKPPVLRHANMFKRSASKGSRSAPFRRATLSDQTPPQTAIKPTRALLRRTTSVFEEPPPKRGMMKRGQSFSNLLSASFKIINGDTSNFLSSSMNSDSSESQDRPKQTRQRVIDDNKEDECPRLQQLKEQSIDELRSELAKMQVMAQNNLERSWAEAERIRQSNDDLDDTISTLKVKLAEAKAVPGELKHRCSLTSQSSGGMVDMTEEMPQSKGPSRNFSSAALNMFLGGNFYDENTPTVLTKSKSDSQNKGKPKRRPTLLSELSSFGLGAIKANSACDASSSTCSVGMNMDDRSQANELAMSQASNVHSLCYDDNNSEVGSGILRRVSRYNDDKSQDGSTHNIATDIAQYLSADDLSCADSHFITDNDNVSEIRSAIESVHSGANFLPREHNIFEVEASAALVEDLNEQLSKCNEKLMKIVAALQKQNTDIKTCFAEIESAKEGQQVKKLREQETTTVHDLHDFIRCFRALDGKLQIVEGAAFDVKTALEEYNRKFTFNDVRLNKNKLLQAKIIVGSNDEDIINALEILNDASAFRRYQESRERIMGNIYRLDSLEADLWNQLVNIRLLIEQVGDEEGTQTTESSMASERRALERVFVEAIIPHVGMAQLTKTNLLLCLRENIKILRWWNHLIHGMECHSTYQEMPSCMDFIMNEPSLSLRKDISLLQQVVKVTSENLTKIEADVKQECKSFRSKVERAGLLFDSSNEMTMEDNKQSSKARSLFQNNKQNSTNKFHCKLLEQKRILSEKDKLFQERAAELEAIHLRAHKELGQQLETLDKMHHQVQIFTSKMVEQDSLLSSLKKAQAKKLKRVLRFQKTAGRHFMNTN